MSDDQNSTNGSGGKTATKPRRKYLSQADVPEFKLEDALRVPRAIADSYGKHPTSPLDIAAALEIQPGRYFRGLTGASIAYGLTEGGAQAESISLTDLGMRVVAPTEEGDDQRALRESLLRPRVIREFLTRYNNSKFPPDHIARNVLESLDVPAERANHSLELIKDSMMLLGIYREIKGDMYVRLDLEPSMPPPGEVPAGESTDAETEVLTKKRDADTISLADEDQLEATVTSSTLEVSAATGRVFITHGKKSDAIVKQLKEILGFGGFEPVVAEERETTARPVPEKVIADMRSCSAAIIHVSGERRVLDQEGTAHVMLNENVLIEIGAAMALYGDRFILLVEKGVELPSNLQGLYQARYEGKELDQPATMKLLKAFKDFRG